MSNPNLDRSKAYLRQGNKMFFPMDDTGKRSLVEEHLSITRAKWHSRQLMKQGHVIVTRES